MYNVNSTTPQNENINYSVAFTNRGVYINICKAPIGFIKLIGKFAFAVGDFWPKAKEIRQTDYENLI